MIDFSAVADDFFVNLNLVTEMPLAASREAILGFFERVQKSYPTMKNFYARESGDSVLEEEKDRGHYRWMALEARRICSGYVNPPNLDAAVQQHELFLQLIPFMLSVSPLECETMDLLFGFDFAYRGNHDALVAEALGMSPSFDGFREVRGAQLISFEPSVTIALDESCRLQSRLMIETRTTANHVRRGEFPEEQISVYFTVRRYGSLEPGMKYEEMLSTLRMHADQLLEGYVVEQVLRPLAQAISAR